MNVFPTVNVDISGTQFDISHADVYADSAMVDICSAIINADSVNLDISNATLQVDTVNMDVSSVSVTTDSVTMDVSSISVTTDSVNMDVSSVSVTTDSVTMDVSSISVTATAAAIDISNATLQVDSVTMDVSSVSVTATAAAIDISNATLQVDTIAMDVSSISVTTIAAAIDISNATLQVDTIAMDVSSVSVTTTTAAIDISNATLQVDTIAMDVSSISVTADTAAIDISSAIIDICSGSVTISNVTLSGNLGVLANDDAFGRLRVSNPYTLYEFNSIIGKQADIIDEDISGSGSTTAAIGASYIALNVSGEGYAIRQSHEYIMYQPGKSKLVYMTGVLQDPSGADMSGNTARIGCFDASMGFYIESSSGIVSVYKTNSVTDRIYRHQSEGPPDALYWDDPLDGSGASGVTVNFRRAQIFTFDFEWLGVGTVRCGIIIGGRIIYYYTFKHVNELVMPYIPMAKLPLRYEIRGKAGAAPNEMRMICGTVMSEGGFSPIGKQFIVGDYTTGTTLSNTTYIPLIALRLTNVFPYSRTTIKLKDLDIFNSSTGTSGGSWKILFNPTFTFSGTWGSPTSSLAEIAISTVLTPITDVSGGKEIYSGFYASRDYNQLTTSIDEIIASQSITVGLNGRSDTIVLVTNNLLGTSRVNYALKWIEYI